MVSVVMGSTLIHELLDHLYIHSMQLGGNKSGTDGVRAVLFFCFPFTVSPSHMMCSHKKATSLYPEREL